MEVPKDTIRVASGHYVNLKNPRPETIKIEDIAHALANIARFGGHYPVHLSVATHSLAVEARLAKLKKPAKCRLHGLLHDAAEAYIHDVPTPVKKLMTGYYGIEQQFLDVIFAKYGIEEHEFQQDVAEADEYVFQVEWSLMVNNQFAPSKRISEEKKAFLQKFFDLVRMIETEKTYETSK